VFYTEDEAIEEGGHNENLIILLLLVFMAFNDVPSQRQKCRIILHRI
jgi:hypothetical protein